MRKKFYHILLAAAAAAMLLSGCKGKGKEAALAQGKNEAEQEHTEADAKQKDTGDGEIPAEPKKLTLWYTQPDLESYFTEMAAYYEAETGTQIETVQVSALDYIEAINDRSVKDLDYPDLYVATPDLLEKAKLAGLTMKAKEDVCSTANFSQKALDAVTYKGERIAYPFYTDTSVLVFNKNYVEEAPATIEDIQNFSENFEGDGNVQNIFVWNVNDIFVDFFTIGNYVNLGGAHGDDLGKIVLNNEQIQSCLSFYQELSQFFAIDRSLVSEDQIVEDFAQGKTVFAIIRDDSVAKLDELVQAANEGRESEETPEMSYGIGMVPDLTGELLVRPLSVTHSIAVNGYTREPGEAENFAEYLTVARADSLYEMSTNFPAKKGVSYENPEISAVLAQYEEAVEVPKIMQMSNYWILMEPVFAEIWTGADVASWMEEAETAMGAALGNENSGE